MCDGNPYQRVSERINITVSRDILSLGEYLVRLFPYLFIRIFSNLNELSIISVPFLTICFPKLFKLCFKSFEFNELFHTHILLISNLTDKKSFAFQVSFVIIYFVSLLFKLSKRFC